MENIRLAAPAKGFLSHRRFPTIHSRIISRDAVVVELETRSMSTVGFQQTSERSRDLIKRDKIADNRLNQKFCNIRYRAHLLENLGSSLRKYAYLRSTSYETATRDRYMNSCHNGNYAMCSLLR